MAEPQVADQGPAAPAPSGAPAASSGPVPGSAPSASNGSRRIAWVLGLGLAAIAVAIIIAGSMLRTSPTTGGTPPPKQQAGGAQQPAAPTPPAEDPNALVIVRRGALAESTKADVAALQAALKKHVLNDADVAKARQASIEKAVDDFFRPAGE